MLYAFAVLICRKLCRHNRRISTGDRCGGLGCGGSPGLQGCGGLGCGGLQGRGSQELQVCGGQGCGVELVGGMAPGGTGTVLGVCVAEERDKGGCEEVRGMVGSGQVVRPQMEESVSVSRNGVVEGTHVNDIILDTGCA